MPSGVRLGVGQAVVRVPEVLQPNVSIDCHAVHRFAHILKNGVPEVLAPAFAVFVKRLPGQFV